MNNKEEVALAVHSLLLNNQNNIVEEVALVAHLTFESRRNWGFRKVY